MTTRIALIHALTHSIVPINEGFARLWPQAELMNLLDDSLSADLARSGQGLDAFMHERFARLAQYAVDTGCDGILFTCSAFGSCIEAVAEAHPTIPVLKPNEAMIAQATQLVGDKDIVGLISSFAPTLVSMPAEFPAHIQLQCELVSEAMDALNTGNGELHDDLVEQTAIDLKQQGVKIIALAQFSMARAKERVQRATGLPVLTTVDSAVEALKARFA